MTAVVQTVEVVLRRRLSSWQRWSSIGMIAAQLTLSFCFVILPTFHFVDIAHATLLQIHTDSRDEWMAEAPCAATDWALQREQENKHAPSPSLLSRAAPTPTELQIPLLRSVIIASVTLLPLALPRKLAPRSPEDEFLR